MSLMAEIAVRNPATEARLAPPTHPVTILVDRRPGQMLWVAVPFETEDLSFPEWDDPDEVADFWADMSAEPMGRGDSPNAALAALHNALAQVGGYDVYARPVKYQRESAWGR